MKYNTISTSNFNSEGKKATFTVYADMETSEDQAKSAVSEAKAIKGQLEIVQHALNLQTQRCRQLVTEYTRRLQVKEQQYQSEKRLRHDQLAQVLRTLLIFEARLRQEQKFINQQLHEKDYIINKQKNDISKLMSDQYCKNCNQYFSFNSNLESLGSSSDYIITDYPDYQSSNFESLDSSSEIYATVSERECESQKTASINSESSPSEDDNTRTDRKSNKNLFVQQKIKKDNLERRKKVGHRKSVGNYFEVLKFRNYNDVENLDSSNEETSEKIDFSKNGENFHEWENKQELQDYNDSCSNLSGSDCNNTVIANKREEFQLENTLIPGESTEDCKESKKVLSVFEGTEDSNDNNWYASASDQEDEEQKDIYRNNPVLECMNQILLQNISDSMISPPKTPDVERKLKNSKRVKFSDEKNNAEEKEPTEGEMVDNAEPHSDYYETPIQKTPNYYETPQSIYSNDYEQILSKCSETFQDERSFTNKITPKKFITTSNLEFENVENKNHYYVEMDTKSDIEVKEHKIIKKSKILRTPPALPPKPANLVSRFKIQQLTNKTNKNKSEETNLDSEPDYCSISELNLPIDKNVINKTINVVAEINAPEILQKSNEVKMSPFSPKVNKDCTSNIPNYNLISLSLAVKKVIKQEKLSPTVDIPKLPQVTEIIIPDENEIKQEHITSDNYIKNNSQILKQKNPCARSPIVIGTSVSSLITSFNTNQLSQINQKSENMKPKKMFSSFENLQNLDKQTSPEVVEFEKFDLSQNFEEFKLDDCEIGEEYHIDMPTDSNSIENYALDSPTLKLPYTDFIQESNNLGGSQIKNSGQKFDKQFRTGKEMIPSKFIKNNKSLNIPTKGANYEHFLECTGLSSKSILSPPRFVITHNTTVKSRDATIRSKEKSVNVKQGNTIKYWSEPYL